MTANKFKLLAEDGKRGRKKERGEYERERGMLGRGMGASELED